jgi:DNA-binding transcriptional LysR family regulator
MDELERIDLNWLRALSYLLETRSVSGAARKAGVSQPAMSRTLAHLRELFHDPLLVQAGRRSLLSEHAQTLQPKLQEALAAIQAALGAAPHFEPESATFDVRVAANDYVGTALLGPWQRKVRAPAPNMRLFLDNISTQSVAQLATGELDFVIGPAVRQPELGLDRFVVRPLWQDRYVCVMRARHPCAGERVALRKLLRQPRIGIDCGGWHSSAEAAITAAGHAWPTNVRVPSFLLAFTLLEESDAIALVPERLVGAHAARCAVRPLPLRCEPFGIYLAWHPRATTNPRHRWLRTSLLEFAAKGAGADARRRSGVSQRTAHPEAARQRAKHPPRG